MKTKTASNIVDLAALALQAYTTYTSYMQIMQKMSAEGRMLLTDEENERVNAALAASEAELEAATK